MCFFNKFTINPISFECLLIIVTNNGKEVGTMDFSRNTISNLLVSFHEKLLMDF